MRIGPFLSPPYQGGVPGGSLGESFARAQPNRQALQTSSSAPRYPADWNMAAEDPSEVRSIDRCRPSIEVG
jgi:hypothetical protein